MPTIHTSMIHTSAVTAAKIKGGTSGQILIGQGAGVGTAPVWTTITGAGSISAAGVLTISGGSGSFANGTAAAPSIAFTNSTGLGFYRNADNALGVALGGVAALALAATSPTIAAATDTAGSDVYWATASAGGTATTAKAGGAWSILSGGGSTGSSGTGTVSGGNGGALVRTGGAGGAATSTAGAGGGAGGAITDTAGAGGSAAGTSAAGPGGAVTFTAGAGGAKTGTGTANGGDGGALSFVAGAGGATASTNAGSIGGAGGSAGVRAGAGGAASAGTANGGNGGSVALQPGVGGTSAGGAAGINGIVYVKGTSPMPLAENQTYTAKAAANATLTAAEHRGGIVSVAANASNDTLTTLTAAQLVAAFPGVQVGSAVPLEVLSLKTTANTVTLAGGANVTAVGNMVVGVTAGNVGLAVKFKILFTNVTLGAEAAQLIRVAG